jgi:hypothetical protein
VLLGVGAGVELGVGVGLAGAVGDARGELAVGELTGEPEPHPAAANTSASNAVPSLIRRLMPPIMSGAVSLSAMCRSIKKLRREGEPATDDEIHEAALQFVRKVSGYRQPSRTNAPAFDEAVEEITAASRRLLDAVAR